MQKSIRVRFVVFRVQKSRSSLLYFTVAPLTEFHHFYLYLIKFIHQKQYQSDYNIAIGGASVR